MAAMAMQLRAALPAECRRGSASRMQPAVAGTSLRLRALPQRRPAGGIRLLARKQGGASKWEAGRRFIVHASAGGVPREDLSTPGDWETSGKKLKYLYDGGAVASLNYWRNKLYMYNIRCP